MLRNHKTEFIRVISQRGNPRHGILRQLVPFAIRLYLEKYPVFVNLQHLNPLRSMLHRTHLPHIRGTQDPESYKG